MTVDGYWEAEPIGNGSRWVLTNAFNGRKVECSKASAFLRRGRLACRS